MRQPVSGNDVPHATYTWPIANQAVAAGAAFTPAAIVVPNAQLGNSSVIVSARAQLPATAAGSIPGLHGFVNAAGQVTLTISNQSAAALVATAADILIDIQVPPILP
jgi:hypothetical protein